MLNLPNEDVDLDNLREYVLRRLPSGSSRDSMERLRNYSETGNFVRPGFTEIPFNDGKMWNNESDRAQSRYMHGFIFFSDWPKSIREDQTGRLAKSAINIISQWHAMYSSRDSANKMAYHDETTAQRMINILAIREAAFPHLSVEEASFLESLLDTTANILKDENFHSTGNNHGMFQDVALINYSVLSGWRPIPARSAMFDLAEHRIQSYFIESFTSEGVHRENTPTYHIMICQQLKSHLDLLKIINHPDMQTLFAILEQASIFATHSIMPSGIFPPVSDTTPKNLTWHSHNLFDDPEFQYAASGGQIGSLPKNKVLVLPDSGYAIYRSSWNDKNATFAYFHAAYNADYHKHSDDLSFLLTSAGVDLLTEAGPHGYNYKDPMTVFAYGQYAHNNIVVNGKSVRRTDSHAKSVRMVSNHVGSDGLSITGITGRLFETEHRRTVEINEIADETLINVLDSVVSENNNRFDLVWNLGPEVIPVVHGQGFELFHKGNKIMDAMMCADVPLKVTLHRGSEKPVRVGWRCPTFGVAEPNFAIVVSFEGRQAEIETKFRLKSFNYLDRGLSESEAGWERFQGSSNLNYTLTPASSAEGAGVLVVVFSAISGLGDFTYNYRASIENCQANILYILDDFGDQGAYYYSDHGDTYIFDATQELIHAKLNELGLSAKNLVTIGSSKGGTAALIHGIAAGASDVFVGAPQTRIGSFVAKPHPNVLRFMAGGTTTEHIRMLDDIVFSIAEKSAVLPTISILVGEADHHYKNHVLPFVEHMAELSHMINLDVRPGLPHAEIGPIYSRAVRAFLASRVSSNVQGNEAIQSTQYPAFSLTSPGGESAVYLQLDNVENNEVSFKLYLGNDVVESIPYARVSAYSWCDLAPGRYRVRVFLRRVDNRSSRKAFTTSWIAIS